MGILQRTFSARLVELCEARKKSISGISADLKINRQQFARYLNQTAIPREATIERIADYFAVHPTCFFSNDALESGPVSTESNTSVNLAFDIMRNARMQPVTPDDLPAGIYTMLKCSFVSSGRLIKTLFQVNYDEGIAHFKAQTYRSNGRGYYAYSKKNITPGSNEVYTGLFLKTNGKLILINTGTTTSHTTLHVFLQEHQFDFNIKPGVHMTLSSNISSGVRSSILVIRKLRPDESVLNHARTSGWVDRNTISDIELDVLSGGTFDYPGIIGV